jgi:osmotically-inducible protein OsmY
MINRNFVGAGLIAALLLGGLGLTAYAMESPQAVSAAMVGTDALDAALNDKVETLLRSDVGLAGSQLRIQGRSGTLTIGGTVPDEHSLRRALDLASSVRGVREIRNAMELTPPK